jgi:hypothetical protein
LDSAVYGLRPVDHSLAVFPADQREAIGRQVAFDNESRFKNSIYPAKLWATYSASGL